MRSSSEGAGPVVQSWRVRRRELALGARTLVMGIVNVTPDSFSDGGKFFRADAAVQHALRLVEDGADILDIGGESTRPGSDPVPEAEEQRRILPVIEALTRFTHVPLSVDTRRASVADAALKAGAHIINDVSSLSDPDMLHVVRDHQAGLVLMHMRGDPKTMQQAPQYENVVEEVAEFLQERSARAEAAGVPRDSIVLDPGLGFGKRTGQGVEDNAVLLKHLARLHSLGYPLLVGASRKSFIGNILKVPLAERLEGSLAAAAVAAWQGAQILRVHDVKSTRRVVDLVDAIRNA